MGSIRRNAIPLGKIEEVLSDKLPTLTSIDYKATDDIDDGTITSATSKTITDDTKDWEVDSLVGKVVRIDLDDENFDFGIIESNTSDTLTLDCDCYSDLSGTYRILDTFTVDKMETMIALDITDNCCAVVMPKSTAEIERLKAHIYIEKAVNGDEAVPIIFRNADRGLGVKYLTLEHRFEGVLLYAHMWIEPHWDILSVFNVKRTASAYITSSSPVNSTTYQVIINDGTFTLDFAKRFVKVIRDGKLWLKYVSRVSTDFIVGGDFTAEKTDGGSGTANFTIRKKEFATGDVTDSGRVASARFSKDEIVTVSKTGYISLAYGDEITLVANRTVGNINLLAGSGIVIREI